MKKAMISLALTTASLNAGAALNCQDSRATIDSGYAIEFSADNSQAQIVQQTIAGPRPVAILECSAPEASQQPSADASLTVLSCSEPELRDAGYTLEVQRGGIAGLTTASLATVSIAGARKIANMVCQSRN